ncbi:hypothetical protein GA0061098_101620 [Bradyrhizobium shewense]|uniref:Uncharacterized protein n=1 Tax=Bradyrhizobium shewense TaxID=1761772 RepID=A0A1C3XHE1_9BRAD|nr:hypothetical protein GA0061098_101620 [Bradyrhizobium shewense]
MLSVPCWRKHNQSRDKGAFPASIVDCNPLVAIERNDSAGTHLLGLAVNNQSRFTGLYVQHCTTRRGKFFGGFTRTDQQVDHLDSPTSRVTFEN